MIHEIKNGHIYRWTEYRLDRRREAGRRRQNTALILGILTGLGLATALAYLFG